ncbi:uncharacterized protein N7482_000467 [Penicillium canariense]|uniref:Uncharacterized protein n=1 Tax=Penicillium canariense TaxID=189055 RepID=A0A9W9LSP1_9EURO|nr:uncharacterized protein N7482_000467 [Penicillium canariense]KAJ5174590.1 hypothetical protein N7482_000467 [Penicillium canariense]
MASQQTFARGALGANYNENLTWIDHRELSRVGARWIRGFIDMHQIDSLQPEQDSNIKALFQVMEAGFNTILSLKWAYADRDFPAVGSPEHTDELECLNCLLEIVMGKVDILVIGNEPFIETKQTGEQLNVFYETVADAVIDFRKAHNDLRTPTQLYMGALNRLDLPAKRTPAIVRMLGFIASRPELDGVDLHLHMPTLAGHRAMLNYALSQIRPDQRFLATEFSMIWHWKKHMNDAASTDFCKQYGFPPGTKVCEVISTTIQKPVPYAQWEDFLKHEPWYLECKSFMGETIRLYRATERLEVATYSCCPMRNRKAPILASDTPWMLNGLFAPSTVQLEQDGSRHENFPWAEEFRRLQRSEQ